MYRKKEKSTDSQARGKMKQINSMKKRNGHARFTLIPEQILTQRRAITPRHQFLMENINKNMGCYLSNALKTKKKKKSAFSYLLEL